jgi:hypothetical protein
METEKKTRHSKLTITQKKYLLQDLHEGMAYKDAAAKYGLSYGYIVLVANKNGIHIKQQRTEENETFNRSMATLIVDRRHEVITVESPIGAFLPFSLPIGYFAYVIGECNTVCRKLVF